MATRILASQARRGACVALRNFFIPSSSHCLHRIILQSSSDVTYSGRGIHHVQLQSMRSMSTSIARLPEISDPNVSKALHHLMAVTWNEIPDEVKDAVEAAVSKQTDDKAGLEELKNAWRAAEAVEKFSGTLVSLRIALDDFNGPTGERVRPLPPLLKDALNAALTRYNTYLGAFKEEEFYLKKKVEVELGSLLLHIRQRCAGLGPEWGSVSLLGTSGISGSFIEHRAQ